MQSDTTQLSDRASRMQSSVNAVYCADCQSAEGSLEVRKRRLCSGCFARYVNSKILKRMESYRFKNLSSDQKKRLFLPLSGGPSSLVLLHVLDAQLQKQIANRNRTAYDLIIAHIVSEPDRLDDVSTDWYEEASVRFATHSFLPPVLIYDAFREDTALEEDIRYIGAKRKPGESHSDFYRSLLTSATSVTTRTDLQDMLLKRLLVALAKQHECESVLWGCSDSRLAAQALADVAKGRGGSVPSAIADGPSMQGVHFNYPVRDLFRTELESYAAVLPDPLSPLLAKDTQAKQPIPSIRNTSIDDLLTNYINSQGEKYPSIMANVVRTASKLQVTPLSDTANTSCPVCRNAVVRDVNGVPEGANICYGCQRMRKDIQKQP